jgi:formylglycine-generating enzyme required for sulfatase activity
VTPGARQAGGDVPLPDGAEATVDPQLWNALLGTEAKVRGGAVIRIAERGENDAYGAALALVVEDADYPFPRRRAAGSALGLIGDPRTPTREPAMVRVPGGPFLMGTLAEDEPKIIREYRHARVQPRFVAKEMPQHEVDVAEFEIGKYPVTNREYAEFVEATGRGKPASWTGVTYPEGKSNHPVVRITHDDAVAYTEWLTKETGAQFRLPTEAEWEKAARGTDGRLYPWGSEFDPDRCNTLEGNTMAGLYKKARPVYNVVLRIGSVVVDSGILGDRFDQALATTPVGIYPSGASPYGALDMAGNAEEWVADRFSLYPGYPFEPEKYDWSAEDWVCRGGAWNRPGDVARTARRHGNFVGVGSIGLRLARDVRA